MRVLINIAVMIGLLGFLYYLQRKQISFGKRVFTALVLGIIVGAAMQLIYNPENAAATAVSADTVNWLNIVGTGYTRLLQMIVIPLVFVSVTTAIANLRDAKVLGKYSGYILSVLILTAAAAALISVFVTGAFQLDSGAIAKTVAETERISYYEEQSSAVNGGTIAQKIIDIIPTNVFHAMAGQAPNATLGVVIFAMFFGIAVLYLKGGQPEAAAFLTDLLNAGQAVVMQIVDFVLMLTPYGIFALMTKFLAQTQFAAISELGVFVIANYVSLALILVLHCLILAVFRFNPVAFLRKSAAALSFAFTSRSSMATLPLTVDTMTKKLDVPEGIASIAATFGTTIGQNGCAGMYPAMLAVMIAPTVGINPLSPGFIIQLVIVVAISSFGIAGVGGGATMAALVVLSAMNLPVGLAGLLVSIEPLIDMGRTAVNVSGAMLAGVITGKITGESNLTAYNAADIAEN